MPQQEHVPKAYTSLSSSDTSLRLQTTDTPTPIDFTFEAIKPGLFRTTFTSETHPPPPFPSARKPIVDNGTFTSTSTGSKSRTFASGNIEARVDWDVTPIVSVGFARQQPLHTDLPFRSYVLDGPG